MSELENVLARAAGWLAAPAGESPESTEAVIRALFNELLKRKWISIADRLPDYDVEVLTFDEKYQNVGERWCTKKSGDVWRLAGHAEDEDAESLAVTYWMPLPENPSV